MKTFLNGFEPHEISTEVSEHWPRCHTMSCESRNVVESSSEMGLAPRQSCWI